MDHAGGRQALLEPSCSDEGRRSTPSQGKPDSGRGDITVNMRIPRARRTKRLPIFFGLALVVGLISFSAVGSAAGTDGFTASALTPDSTFSASKSDSGQLAKTDPSLLNRSDATPVDVMIKYDYDATASYTGGVAGLAPTSPAVTGQPLDKGSAAITAYDNYTDAKANIITAAVQQAVPGADVGDPVNTVYGGVRRRVPANSDRLRSFRSRASRRCRRTRCTSRRTTTRRSSARRPSGRRSAARRHAGNNVIDRRASTPASGPRIRCSPRRACRLRPAA